MDRDSWIKEIPLSDNTRDQHVVEIVGSPAGRYAGKLFRDSGARVVQLCPEENPDEDTPPALDAGKQQEPLESDPQRRSTQLESWLSWADVVIESAAPGPLLSQVPRKGFPRLIHLRISPFDTSGPYAHYQSNAFTDQAFGGQLYLSGESHREPLGHPAPHLGVRTGGDIMAKGGHL